MAIPASKQELTDALRSGHDKLISELSTVPAEKSRDRVLTGAVSVCDIVAYQVGWSKLLAGWYETAKQGHMPDLPAANFKWNQLGELASHFYKTYQDFTLAQLIIEFETAYEHVMRIVEENTNEALYTIGTYSWTGDKWTLGRWINVNTSSPYKSAAAKIRAWKKTIN